MAVAAGVLAAGLLTSMMAPAFAEEAAARPPQHRRPPATQNSSWQRRATTPSAHPLRPATGFRPLPTWVTASFWLPTTAAPTAETRRRQTPSSSAAALTAARPGVPPPSLPAARSARGGNLQYGFSDPSYVVDKETGNVFNFHVYSKNQGFFGSVLGTDDANRDVTGTEVSVSTDKGLTWSTDPSQHSHASRAAKLCAGFQIRQL